MPKFILDKAPKVMQGEAKWSLISHLHTQVRLLAPLEGHGNGGGVRKDEFRDNWLLHSPCKGRSVLMGNECRVKSRSFRSLIDCVLIFSH